MNKSFLANPFIVLSLSFPLVFIIYKFSWSNLYPQLSIELFIFLALTSLFSFLIGFFLYKKNLFLYKPILTFSVRKIRYTVLSLIILILIECLLQNNMPILSLIFSGRSDYEEFGVPYLHLFVVSFSGFYTVYIIHCLLSTKNKKDKNELKFWYTLLLLSPIIYFNRGAIMMSLACSLFLYIMSVNNMKKITTKLLVIVLLFLYLFGLAGNYRSGGDNKENYIVDLGGATSEFKDSFVPNEFFWAYLYISSPLANLQYNINTIKEKETNYSNFEKLIVKYCLPSIIGKQIQRVFGEFEDPKGVLIIDELNVCSYYYSAYNCMGYAGMAFIFIWVLLLTIVLFLIVPPKSPFFISSIVIIDSVIIFNTFTNMLVFDTLILQLLIPTTYHILLGNRLP